MDRIVRFAIGICAALAVGCELTPQANEPRDDPADPKSDARTSPDGHRKDVQPLITNSLGMAMVFIPAGEFHMGSAESEHLGDFSRCEGPRHLVRITSSVRMSRHEVTVEQFHRFVQATGHVTDAELSKAGCNGLDVATGHVTRRLEFIWKSPGFPQSEQHPVVCISWKDAVAFCSWLSVTTDARYRLPTEAEWEYCCRAGTDTFLSTGDGVDTLRLAGNCGDQSLRERCPSLDSGTDWDDGFPFTAPAGSFQPNNFGLYDMHGNVGEWCQDWFDADYYSTSPIDDPRGSEQHRQWRVVRGGSWYNNPISCRSSGRHDGVPTEASTTNGFRVVMEMAQTPE